MNRKETTRFLSDLLISKKLTGMGKYWASEVTLDYGWGRGKEKRVDFMQFLPPNQINIDGIEKGIFICYEVKSCKEDVYSGNGLNFIGEKNYIVTTMECWKDIQPDMRSGKLLKHIKECCPEASAGFGIMVPVPLFVKPEDEYVNPTKLDSEVSWELKVVLPCREGGRKRSMIELLFCMLRSKHWNKEVMVNGENIREDTGDAALDW